MKYAFAKEYRENETKTDIALVEEAVKAYKGYDRVLVFADLTDCVESEGADVGCQNPCNFYPKADSYGSRSCPRLLTR